VSVARSTTRGAAGGARAELAAANAARDRRDWGEAAARYRAYLDQRPHRFAIWVQYGHALKELGQRAAALAAYSEALRHEPDNADLLVNLGHLHKLMGHGDQAVAFYQRAADLEPSDEVFGELRNLGSDPERARLRAPASAGQGAARVGRRHWIVRGNDARAQGDWVTAAIAYQAHVRMRPGDFAIWVQLGHALKESGRRESALEAYHTALRLRPDDADVLLHLGHLHKMMGRIDRAVGFYQRSARLDPTLDAIRELKALGAEPVAAPPPWRAPERPVRAKLRMRIELGAFSGARKALIAGNRARDRNDWAAAAEAYRAHLKSSPGNFPIWVQLGHALKESGQLREASLAYGEAMNLNHADPDLLLNLGHLCKLMDDRTAAVDYYLRSAEIDGNAFALEEIRALSGEIDRTQTSSPPHDPGLWGGGRSATPGCSDEDHCPPCTAARILVVKDELSSEKQIALLVTHSEGGFIKKYVERYIDALVKNDIKVVLIIAAGQARTIIANRILNKCAAVVVRQNVGFDFAAWAHVMTHLNKVLSSNTLFLLNDSVIGPVNYTEFSNILSAIHENQSDIVGLTENFREKWHIQSYFFAIKKKALSNYGFHQYMGNIASLGTKEEVICKYEITFSSSMEEKGISCGTIFGRPQGDTLDDTISNWQSLLGRGMSFVKRSLIAGDHRDKGGDQVERELAERGYPMDLLKAGWDYHDRAEPHIVANLRAMGGSYVERPGEGGAVASQIGGTDQTIVKRPEDVRVTFLSPSGFANGLGAAARGYVSAFLHTRLICNFEPIKKPFHVHARVAPTWVVSSSPGAPDVAVVHLNPDAWNGLLTRGDREIIASAKRRIGIFVWELSIIPSEWLPVLNLMDALIAPSEYCAELFRRVADVPVYVASHVVALPPPPVSMAGRDSEGAPRLRGEDFGGRRILLYAFDGSSFLDRKNPFALVRAFKCSGLGDQGWQLVLKTKHLFNVKAEGERLLAEIGGYDRISLIDRAMTSREMEALFGRADIYASPHSSEGFGLTIAEAMAMGKIVVATHYGGSVDFLDETTGFPVPARETELAETCGPYLKGGKWGVVDEDKLCAALLAAADEASKSPRGAITPLGARARKRVGAQLSAAAVGKTLESIILKVDRDPQVSDRSVQV
jgi:tetratricopeptide (TPR) repeat protein